jgi:hypothetical protein
VYDIVLVPIKHSTSLEFLEGPIFDLIATSQKTFWLHIDGSRDASMLGFGNHSQNFLGSTRAMPQFLQYAIGEI